MFIGALRDVTESMVAEEALRQSPLRARSRGAGDDGERVDGVDCA